MLNARGLTANQIAAAAAGQQAKKAAQAAKDALILANREQEQAQSKVGTSYDHTPTNTYNKPS